MKKIISLLFAIIGVIPLFSQLVIDGSGVYGGSGDDVFLSASKTFDGGLIFSGRTASEDGDIPMNHGYKDLWVVKLDNRHELEWSRTYGGNYEDGGGTILQLESGNYVIGGFCSSYDQDLEGRDNPGEFWMLCLDSVGEIVENTTYGGTGIDIINSCSIVNDTNFIAVGYTASADYTVDTNRGEKDAWILLLSSRGEVVWDTTYGGSLYEYASAIISTPDQGFVFTGTTASADGDVNDNAGSSDVWIVKTDSAGNMLWEHTIGGSDVDYGNDIVMTDDGNYVIVGASRSSDGDLEENLGNHDAWIAEVNETGEVLWQKNMGHSGSDQFKDIVKLEDGYLVSGSTCYNENMGSKGQCDWWVVKFSLDGEPLWESGFGGSYADFSYDMIDLGEGHYLIAGESMSDDGDIGSNKGGSDACFIVFHLVELGIASGAEPLQYHIFPNPAGSQLHLERETNHLLSVRVFDLSGRILYTAAYSEKNIRLDTDHLDPGMYMLHLQEEGRSTFLSFCRK